MIAKSPIKDFLSIVAIMVAAWLIGHQYINNCHDWGDDFAQYLLQGKQLISQSNTDGNVLCTAGYSPGVRGPLFTVMVSMLTANFYQIFILKWIILVAFTLTVIIFYLKLRHVLHWLTALMMSIFLLVNYHFIKVVDQVLPDTFFLLAVLISCFLMEMRTKFSIIAAAMFAAFATGLRDAGWILLPVYMIFSADRSSIWPGLKSNFLLFVTPFLSVYLLIAVPVATALGGNLPVSWYLGTIVNPVSGSGFIDHLSALREGFISLFEYEIPVWVNRYLGLLILILATIGMVIKFRKKFNPGDLFAVSYLLLLFIYPYHQDTARFFLPIMPFVMVWVALAVIKLSAPLLHTYAVHTATILFLALLIFNFHHYPLNAGKSDMCDTDTRQLFRFTTEVTTAADLVQTDKPWTVSLYAGVNTIPLTCISLTPDFYIERSDNPVKPSLPAKLIYREGRYKVYQIEK